jgi:hypothetical protein
MQRPLFPIFISAALIVMGYAALVQFMPFTVEKGRNQDDTNMIRAQGYLAKPDAGTVLVGSSLTFRLPPPVLGPDIANLAIAGGSSTTGLTLIARSAEQPKLVLIEINLLARGTDKTWVESLLRFPERQLRNGLRVFRAGYDPVNLTQRGIQALLHKKDEDLVPQPDAIRELIAGQRRTLSHPVDAASLSHSLDETASLVSALEARGIRIGFFEMPMDASLMDLPGEKNLRLSVASRFPAGRFCWLKLSVPGGAHTIDGIHLITDEAALVAAQLVGQHKSCLKS